MEPDTDLSLVATDAMVEELAKRFDTMVFSATVDMKYAGDHARCEERRRYFAHGDKMRCVGLAAALQHRLLSDLDYCGDLDDDDMDDEFDTFDDDEDDDG